MTSSAVYYRSGQDVSVAPIEPARTAFYRDLLLRHRFRDAYGHVPATGEDALLWVDGQILYSSCGVPGPGSVLDFSVSSSDGQNGCWAPNPNNAVPEYVGVRFADPVCVTGFQFASGLFSAADCPFGYGPCACPTDFSFEASQDEITWTTLYAASDYGGMRVAQTSPFYDETSDWWEGGVFLSERLDLENDHYYRSYRMVVSAFRPDKNGNYNVSELVFYGRTA
jgi:hypothetical protein